MSMHGRHRMTPAEAERLFRSGATGDGDALSALIAAASRPAGAGELAGEAAALRQFRAAHLETGSRPRRPALLKTVLANVVAAKVALTATLAAAATGGIAFAAASLDSPGSSGGPHSAAAPYSSVSRSNDPSDESADPTPGESDESSASTGEPSESAGEPSQSDSESPGSESPHPKATPSPSLSGLCKAYRAGATDNPGKAISNPAFSVLVAAAGGVDNLGSYCDTLLGPAPSRSHGKPSTHPSGKHSTHPGGKPSTHPSGRRSTHPGGGSGEHGRGKSGGHPSGSATPQPSGTPTQP